MQVDQWAVWSLQFILLMEMLLVYPITLVVEAYTIGGIC